MIAETEIEIVMIKLNDLPRQCLGFKALNKVIIGVTPNVVLSSRKQA